MRSRKAPEAAASKQPPRNKLLDAVTLCFSQKTNIASQENDARTEILSLCAAEGDVISEYLDKQSIAESRRQRRHEHEQEQLFRRASREIAVLPEDERTSRAKFAILEERVIMTLGRLKYLEWLGLHLEELRQDLVKKEELQRYFLEKAQGRQRRHVEEVYGAKLYRAPLEQFGRCPFSNPSDCPFRGNCYGSPIKGHQESNRIEAAAGEKANCRSEGDEYRLADSVAADFQYVDQIPIHLLR